MIQDLELEALCILHLLRGDGERGVHHLQKRKLESSERGEYSS